MFQIVEIWIKLSIQKFHHLIKMNLCWNWFVIDWNTNNVNIFDKFVLNKWRLSFTWLEITFISVSITRFDECIHSEHNMFQWWSFFSFLFLFSSWFFSSWSCGKRRKFHEKLWKTQVFWLSFPFEYWKKFSS